MPFNTFENLSVHKIKMDPALARRIEEQSNKIQLYEGARPGVYFLSNFSLKNLAARKHHKFELIKTYKGKKIPVRLDFPSQSVFFAPPDSEATQEVLAKAMAQQRNNKKVQVLYWGRVGGNNSHSFTLDRPGGKRRYHWEIPTKVNQTQDIRSLFPNLIRRIKDPNTKVIVSFGSGGIRLFAHPSLMKFFHLLNLRDQIDEVWGCSGGALAGLLFSLDVSPDLIEEEGYNLYNERYSFRLSPSVFQVLFNIIKESVFLSSDEMLKGFMDCQNTIRQLMGKHTKKQRPKIPFFCITYNLKACRNEILTPNKGPWNSYDLPIFQAKAMDAVIASSSIPILYVPKVIMRGKTNHHYVDGATTEELPLQSPYKKWRQDRKSGREKRKKLLVIAVDLFPRIGENKLFSNYLFQRIPFFSFLQLSANFADLVREARILDQKSPLLHDKDVTLWNLQLPMKGTALIDTRSIPEVIVTAQKAFFEQLRQIEKSEKR